MSLQMYCRQGHPGTGFIESSPFEWYFSAAGEAKESGCRAVEELLNQNGED
jgi:hypothetical protein